MSYYTMTDEIAYKLGKFDFPHFYQSAVWKVNKEPFELMQFFNWGLGIGMPCKKVGDKYETDWENIQLHGSLKLEMIKEISHKLAYIRGRLTSYSVTIKEDYIGIGYANSYNFRDFIARCFHDVIFDKFCLEPEISGQPGRSFRNNPPKFEIKNGETVGTIPGTPYVELFANKEIVDYIVKG